MKRATDQAAVLASAAAAAAASLQGSAAEGGASGAAAPGELHPAPSQKAARLRGLKSSLELEDGLRNHWYPVHFTAVRALLGRVPQRPSGALSPLPCSRMALPSALNPCNGVFYILWPEALRPTCCRG